MTAWGLRTRLGDRETTAHASTPAELLVVATQLRAAHPGIEVMFTRDGLGVHEQAVRDAALAAGPRPHTAAEVRQKIIEHVSGMVDYWHCAENKSELEKLEGLAFSFFTMLDGMTTALPAFELYPAPHPSDQEDAVERGENWYDSDVEVTDNTMLHDAWSDYRRRR